MKRLLYIVLLLMFGGVAMQAIGGKQPRSSEADMALYNYFYMEGEKQNALGNFDAAMALLGEATRIYPEGSAAQYSLAKMYLLLNRTDTALLMLKGVAESDTTHFWYNLGYANTAIHAQQYAEAERIFKRLILNHPDHPEIYNSLAMLYSRQKMYKMALACYDSVETYMGNSPELVGNRIGLYDLLGDTATAIAMAEELVKGQEDNVYYLLYLSDVYRHYGLNSQMYNSLLKVQQEAPEEPLVYMQLASYYLLEKDTTAFYNQYDLLLNNENIPCEDKFNALETFANEATRFTSDSVIIDYYRKLVDLYPYEYAPRNSYALMLIYTHRLDEACQQLTTIAEQSDKNGQIWEQIMSICVDLGKYAEAVDAGKKAIEAGRKECSTYIYLSNALLIDKQYDQAEQYAQTALDSICTATQRHERSYLYGILAEVYSGKGVLEKCYQCYDSALVYNSNNAMVLNNYAYKLATNGGDLYKAESMSSKSLNLEPDNTTYIDTYAWILFKMNSYSLARIYIEKALDKLSDGEEGSAEYYEHYGDILIMQGETDKAIEQWQKALERAPERTLLKQKIEQKQYIEE
ncbi:MAG: tetratricopeptide repeat protein [Bacteroidaceae bacterium]|nr:tetratricopeptide repeat protein [Bacteroidaceae bacterium]